jgi:hypothetical protein
MGEARGMVSAYGEKAAHFGASSEKSSFWIVLFKGGRKMPLQAGFTRYRGRIMNGLEAEEFRRPERRLRRYVDLRRPIEAMQVLQRIKEFAGDH